MISFCFVMSFSDSPPFNTALSHRLFNDFTSFFKLRGQLDTMLHFCLYITCVPCRWHFFCIYCLHFATCRTLIQVSIPKLDFTLVLVVAYFLRPLFHPILKFNPTCLKCGLAACHLFIYCKYTLFHLQVRKEIQISAKHMTDPTEHSMNPFRMKRNH